MGRTRETLTDEQVEMEIARLRQTEEVALAEKEVRLKNRRRIYMSQLRYLEKRGKELKRQGITFDNIKSRLFGDLPDEE